MARKKKNEIEKKWIALRKSFSKQTSFMSNAFQARKKISSKKDQSSNKQYSSRFLQLSMKEQTFFAKRLSFLIKASVPVLESLHMIREQTISKRYARVLDRVIDDVSNGQSLSMSLGKFNRIFGDFSINIIHVGETTGVLSENLEYLAEEMKKNRLYEKKLLVLLCTLPSLLSQH